MASEGEIQGGKRLAERYELVDLLGEGSFGEVWRARDQHLAGRHVAVKILFAPLSENGDAVRFDAEVEALCKIQHPAVVTVLDRGVVDGRRYVVTELVEGPTLASWIDERRARKGAPELTRIARIFDHVCAGVAAAHGLEPPVAHRDLKPQNVVLFRESDGEHLPKIIDFGLARHGDRKGTRTGDAVGTLAYMAPEQALGRVHDMGLRSDVFSLAVILFEMLCFQAVPERTDVWWAVTVQGQRAVRAALCTLPPSVSDSVLEVLERCFQKEPMARPADAQVLRELAASAFAQPAEGLTRRAFRLLRRRTMRALYRVRARDAPRWLAVFALLLLASATVMRYARRPPVDVRCEQGDGAACYTLATGYEKSAGEQDPAKVLELYQKACNRDSPEGCLRQGDLLARDREHDADAAEAYARACTGGVARACHEMGAFAEDGRGLLSPEPARALGLYQRACELGHAPACKRSREMALPPSGASGPPGP